MSNKQVDWLAQGACLHLKEWNFLIKNSLKELLYFERVQIFAEIFYVSLDVCVHAATVFELANQIINFVVFGNFELFM